MNFTIEELLESYVKHIQDTWRDDEQHERAKENLVLVCAGIVAGIKSVKQEKSDDDTLSRSAET